VAQSDLPSRVINNAKLEEKSSAPNAKSSNSIRERHPLVDVLEKLFLPRIVVSTYKRNEKHPSEEIHAAEIRSGDQNECNRTEDELEVDHGGLRIVLI
jgi:hypothetical protein